MCRLLVGLKCHIKRMFYFCIIMFGVIDIFLTVRVGVVLSLLQMHVAFYVRVCLVLLL